MKDASKIADVRSALQCKGGSDIEVELVAWNNIHFRTIILFIVKISIFYL